MAKEYQDILYEVRDGVVRITINRPEVYNAFRNQTLEELIDGLRRADEEKSANVMVLAGAGDKAFCTGGDQKVHLSEDGLSGPPGTGGRPDEGRPPAPPDPPQAPIRQGPAPRARGRPTCVLSPPQPPISARRSPRAGSARPCCSG